MESKTSIKEILLWRLEKAKAGAPPPPKMAQLLECGAVPDKASADTDTNDFVAKLRRQNRQPPKGQMTPRSPSSSS
jgi:hypothetical protein